jgi:hypothetical protein
MPIEPVEVEDEPADPVVLELAPKLVEPKLLELDPKVRGFEIVDEVVDVLADPVSIIEAGVPVAVPKLNEEIVPEFPPENDEAVDVEA